MNTENKNTDNFTCDKCNYKCKFESEWKKHLNTGLHKDGIRKKRSDFNETKKCELCEYKTQNKTVMKKHFLNEHASKKDREKDFKYYCSTCDFGTFCEKTINVHNNTKKHIKYIDRKK